MDNFLTYLRYFMITHEVSTEFENDKYWLTEPKQKSTAFLFSPDCSTCSHFTINMVVVHFWRGINLNKDVYLSGTYALRMPKILKMSISHTALNLSKKPQLSNPTQFLGYFSLFSSLCDPIECANSPKIPELICNYTNKKFLGWYILKILKIQFLKARKLGFLVCTRSKTATNVIDKYVKT